MTEDFPRFDVTGQVALVTGAARGLGRAISLALAHAGADIALGLRDRSSGDELVREIESLGRRALPLQMDMGRLDHVRILRLFRYQTGGQSAPVCDRMGPSSCSVLQQNKRR